MRKKVLIIDDNPANNEHFIEPLENRFEVTVVMKLVSAERLIRIQYYDFIIIDVMMPSQGLLDVDEMLTGFVFYRDFILPLGLNSKIVFWSRFNPQIFTDFWEVPPSNAFYLQKSYAIDHLLEFLLSIDK